jgi:hypothetical protein
MARSVLVLKEADIILPLFADETHDPKLWLFQLSNILKQESFIEILVTLWAIWWARRKVIPMGQVGSSAAGDCKDKC